MMIRSISGIDRASSTSYVVLPPGMPVVATTPARTPCCEKASTPIAESTVISTSLVSSLLVFLMWVGGWGCIDTLVEMTTAVPLYQVLMYTSILIIASLLLWWHFRNLPQMRDITEDELRV